MTQFEEDSRDLELREELRRAYEDFLHAPEHARELAARWYKQRLKEFAVRVTR